MKTFARQARNAVIRMRSRWCIAFPHDAVESAGVGTLSLAIAVELCGPVRSGRDIFAFANGSPTIVKHPTGNVTQLSHTQALRGGDSPCFPLFSGYRPISGWTEYVILPNLITCV